MYVLNKNAGFPACCNATHKHRDSLRSSGNLHLPHSQIAFNALTRIRLGITSVRRRDSGAQPAAHLPIRASSRRTRFRCPTGFFHTPTGSTDTPRLLYIYFTFGVNRASRPSARLLVELSVVAANENPRDAIITARVRERLSFE